MLEFEYAVDFWSQISVNWFVAKGKEYLLHGSHTTEISGELPRW